MTESKREKGFTLVEVLVVIAIIGILFFIFIPQVNSAFLKSKESGVYTDFRTFQQANESFFRETRGVNLQLSSLNKYLDGEHEAIDNGTIMHTKSNDPWKNPYEVKLEPGKITFSSYGKNEDPAVKVYNLVTYLYNGKIASCTSGLGVKNIQLSIPNLDPNFKCGDDIQTSAPPSNESLGVPSNFIAKNITHTKAEVSWGGVAGASNYILKRNNLIIYIGKNTAFSDITLSAGNTYVYAVAAQNKNGISPYATLSITTSIPVRPSNLFATNVTESSMDLSWNKVENATVYTLKRDGNVIYTGNNIGFSENNLNPYTAYVYSLTAKNSIGESLPVSLNVSTKASYTTVVLPSAGNGSCNPYNPYIITTIGELQAMKDQLTGCYELGKDIDASSTASWDSGKGFLPIRNFYGSFDGKNYKVINLTINRPLEDSVGLFGHTRFNSYKTVKNVGLENVNITGKNYVGALFGISDGNKISNVYSTGFVKGHTNVGGLIGESNFSPLENAYSHASAEGVGSVGGLIGEVFASVEMKNIYSTGNVIGDIGEGGLIGSIFQESPIFINAYWNKESSGQPTSPKGTGKTTNELRQQSTFNKWDFTNVWTIDPVKNNGYPYLKNNAITDENVYLGIELFAERNKLKFSYFGSKANVTYKLYRDGIEIYNGSNSVYQDTGLNHLTNYVYKLEMYDSNNMLLDTVERTYKTKLINIGKGLTHNPYIIQTVDELQKMNLCLSCHYELGKDIDASSTASWDSGKGFSPIRNFNGSFDGKNYKVINLTINRPSEDNVALFGSTNWNSYKMVKNVGLENVNITGKNYVGSLFGYSYGNDTANVYATGFVKGHTNVGGLIGESDFSPLENAYSHVSTEGVRYVGGLIGTVTAPNHFEVKDSYSTGIVIGSQDKGGLIGYIRQESPKFVNTYWNKESSGQPTSPKGTGKTTNELRQQSTFNKWDFTNVWTIDPLKNNGYPYLKNNVPK